MTEMYFLQFWRLGRTGRCGVRSEPTSWFTDGHLLPVFTQGWRATLLVSSIRALIPFMWASLVTQMVKIHLQFWRPGFDPWVGKIPWRRERLPTAVCLPGEFHGQRSLEGYSPRLQRVGHDGVTFTSLHPTNLIILHTVPPSVTITVGIRFQHVNFGGVTNIHSIELPLEWKFIKGPKGEKSPKQLLGTERACPRAPSQTPIYLSKHGKMHRVWVDSSTLSMKVWNSHLIKIWHQVTASFVKHDSTFFMKKIWIEILKAVQLTANWCFCDVNWCQVSCCGSVYPTHKGRRMLKWGLSHL